MDSQRSRRRSAGDTAHPALTARVSADRDAPADAAVRVLVLLMGAGRFKAAGYTLLPVAATESDRG